MSHDFRYHVWNRDIGLMRWDEFLCSLMCDEISTLAFWKHDFNKQCSFIHAITYIINRAIHVTSLVRHISLVLRACKRYWHTHAHTSLWHNKSVLSAGCSFKGNSRLVKNAYNVTERWPDSIPDWLRIPNHSSNRTHGKMCIPDLPPNGSSKPAAEA